MTRQVKVPDDPFDLLADEAFFEFPVAPLDDFSLEPGEMGQNSAIIKEHNSEILFSQGSDQGLHSPLKPIDTITKDPELAFVKSPIGRDKSSPRVNQLNQEYCSEFLPNALPSSLGVGRLRSHLLGYVAGGVLLGILVTGILWLTPKAEEEANFAYLEMRAIGPQGRPVAGALVKQGETAVGHTDSFGEWRRYMKVKMGQTFVLSVSKKTADGQLVATKNIAIPAQMPKSGELEIKTQIGLLRHGYENDDSLAVRGQSDKEGNLPDDATAAVTEPKAKTPPFQDLSDPKNPQESHLSEPKEAEPAVAPAVVAEETVTTNGSNGQNPSQAMVQPSDPSHHGSTKPALWVVPIGDSKSMAGDPGVNALVTSLKIAFEKGGYQVREDAPLVLSVRSLHHQGASFLYARAILKAMPEESERVSSKKLFSFLRGSHADVQSGTEDIIRALSRYGLSLPWTDGQAFCQPAVPCSVLSPPISHIPPLAQWQKMRFKSTLPLGDQTEVFVSGFVARRLGGQIYEFWGPPAGPTNVTLIQGFEVVYREKLTPATQQVLAIPQTLYARVGLPKKASTASSKM
jgi:hypothetical protein